MTDFNILGEQVILNSYTEGTELSLRVQHSGFLLLMQTVFDALWNGACEQQKPSSKSYSY